MKNKIYNALFTALVAVSLSAVLLVTGCSVFAGPDAPGLAGAGGKKAAKTGTLNLSVKGPGGAGASGRTIMPQVVYTAVLTPGTGASTTVTVYDGVNVLSLTPETYSITVTATNGVDSDVVVASGTKTGVEVTATAPTDADITLEENDALSGSGYFDYDLKLFLPHVDSATVVTGTIKIYELPSDFSAVDISAGTGLTPVSGGDITLDSGTDAAAFADSVELDAGNYLVVFKIGDTEWNEVLWIAAGLTSYYVPTFETFKNPSGVVLLALMLQSIEDGDYAALTEHEFVAVDIQGVDKESILDIRAGIATFVGEGYDKPTNGDELATLVDAILVRGGAIGADPAFKEGAADVEIKALAANGSDVEIDWSEWNGTSSCAVTITVGDVYEFTVNILPIAEPEFFEVVRLTQAVPVYRFNLPAGTTFGNYKSIKVSYLVDATNLAKGIRFHRLYGNFNDLTKRFSPLIDGNRFANFNTNSDINDFIYDEKGGAWSPIVGPTADEWYTFTYKLVGNTPFNQNAQKYPADNATGPFYFGMGFPAQDNNIMEYKMKNITLVHKSDPAKNVILNEYSFYGFAGYAPDSVTDEVSRTVEANPAFISAGGTSTVLEELDVTDTITANVVNGSAALDVTSGKLVATFTVNNTRAVVKLDSALVGKIMATDTKSLVIIVDGKAERGVLFDDDDDEDTPDILGHYEDVDDDPDTPDELVAGGLADTANYRYHLGDPTLGASWNGTASFDGGQFGFTINGHKEVGFQGGANHTAANFGGFILQYQGATVTDDEIVVVTINSIKIKIVK